ncbi:3408_t:CDS:2, partial [Funneliformis geosporum]
YINMTSVIKSPLAGGFEGTYEEHVEYIGLRYIMDGETPKKDYFCARKALPYLVDGQKLFPKCGMAICYSCNKVVYPGIEHLSVGERSVYNGLEACTGNKFCKVNFEEYMELKQLIPLDKWTSFHQYYLQINQF